MKLRFTGSGTRIVELEDGGAVFLERGDQFDFTPDLAQKLLLDGTFVAVNVQQMERELLGRSDGTMKDDTEFAPEGPAADTEEHR